MSNCVKLWLTQKSLVIFLFGITQTVLGQPSEDIKTDLAPINPDVARAGKLSDDPNLEERFGYNYHVGNQQNGYGYARRPEYQPNYQPGQFGVEEKTYNPMNNYGPQQFGPPNTIPNKPVQNGYGGLTYNRPGISQGQGIGSYNPFDDYNQHGYVYGQPNIYDNPRLPNNFEGQYGPPRNYGHRGNGYGGYGYGSQNSHTHTHGNGNGYGYYNGNQAGKKEGPVKDLPQDFIRMGQAQSGQSDFSSSSESFPSDEGDSPYYWNKK